MGNESSDRDSSRPDMRDENGGVRRVARFPAALLVPVAVLLVVVGFGLGATLLSQSRALVWFARPRQVVIGSQTVLADGGVTGPSATEGMVEVPKLTGMRADEAALVLDAAGLSAEYVAFGASVSVEASRVVGSQTPAPGGVVSVDTTVCVGVPPLAVSRKAGIGSAKRAAVKGIVCIDPGHQAHSDQRLEPIGPGSKTEKPGASGGATGVSSGVPEYELALQISMNLKRRLEAQGIKVVLTRTTNDVSLSNSARAKIANRAKADLFIRIHGGASTSQGESGIGTLFPANNRWTSGIVVRSRRAAVIIQRAACNATGAVARGAKKETGMAGFNWAEVPSVAVEAGFLSNPLEDRLLMSPSYQDALSQGLVSGILEYLRSEN